MGLAFIRRAWNWAVNIDLLMLLAAAALAFGTWAFVKIAELVTDSDNNGFDEWVLLSVRNPQDIADPVGPKWFEEAVRDITSLGGVAVLFLLVATAASFLVICRRYRTAFFLVLIIIGGECISLMLKSYFDRPRPNVVPALAYVQSASFPSGHAQLSAIIYLSLGTVLARVMPRKPQRVFILSVAMLMTLMIGASRVYLGVHYPTDVLAGWTVGITWALFCWFAARALQRSRAITTLNSTDTPTGLLEPEPQSPDREPHAHSRS